MKKHFYAFAFQYVSGTVQGTSSTYVGYDDQIVTLPRINTAKSGAGVPATAALIGLSYLGYMTEDDFKNTQ